MSSLDPNLRFANAVEIESTQSGKPPVAKTGVLSGLLDSMKVRWISFKSGQDVGTVASNLLRSNAISAAALRWFSDDTIKQDFHGLTPDQLKTGILQAHSAHTRASMAAVFTKTYPLLAIETKQTTESARKDADKRLMQDIIREIQTVSLTNNPAIKSGIRTEKDQAAAKQFSQNLTSLQKQYEQLIELSKEHTSTPGEEEAIKNAKLHLNQLTLQALCDRIGEASFSRRNLIGPSILAKPDVFQDRSSMQTGLAEIKKLLEKNPGLNESSKDLQVVSEVADGATYEKEHTIGTFPAAYKRFQELKPDTIGSRFSG